LNVNTTGDGNVAMGHGALDANTTADDNTAIGLHALSGNTTGTANVGLGRYAGAANTTASSNTAVGHNSLLVSTTGASNVAVGAYALDANTTASNNVAVGVNSMTANTTGGSNVAVGNDALKANTTGANNICVGYQAGDNITTGSTNIIIGHAIDASSATNSNQLNIGGILFGKLGDGSIGIKGVPSNWHASYPALQFASRGFLWAVGDEYFVGHNAYYDAADSRWEYMSSGEASYLKQMDGVLRYANAPSGSADAAVTFTDRFTIAADGATNVVGAFSKGSGSFKIDHPLPEKKDTHYLVHSFIEGPKADLIYRGRVELVNGSATVNVDTVSGMTEGTFVILCDDVQCFTSNETDWDCVRGSVVGNILTIESQDSDSSATISWMVIGDRKDEHMIDTAWTDENGKPIVELPKPEEVEGADGSVPEYYNL